MCASVCSAAGVGRREGGSLFASSIGDQSVSLRHTSSSRTGLHAAAGVGGGALPVHEIAQALTVLEDEMTTDTERNFDDEEPLCGSLRCSQPAPLDVFPL